MTTLAEQDPRYRRHEKRLARQVDLIHRMNKRQLARFLRVKSPQGTLGLGLRKVMRMTKANIAWSIVDLELPA